MAYRGIVILSSEIPLLARGVTRSEMALVLYLLHMLHHDPMVQRGNDIH